MTKAIAKTYSVTNENRIYLTKLFLYGSLLMALVYACNLYNIITRTVAAERLEKEIVKTGVKVQALDAEYISLTKEITPEMAKKYGLETNSVSIYIPRSRSLGALDTSNQL